MKRVINKTPIPMAGLMLASAATGNLVLSYGNIYRNLFGGVAAILLILLLAKLVMNPKALKEGFENPVVASVTPTLSMGIMILSTYLKPYVASVAYGAWILGLVLHCILIACFTKKYLFNFNIKKVFPSYFVVYVGIVVGSVTAPAYNLAKLGEYIFWFGLVSYLALLPIVIYRVVKVKEIPEPASPTLIIFAAPASLCLAGYLNTFAVKSIGMVGFLTTLSLTMLVVALVCMPRLLKLKFYPSYSAFTFPLVISAIAIKLTNGFLIKTGRGIPALNYIVKIEEFMAVAIVTYVLARYIVFLFAKDEQKAIA
ncbi:TDT family transporter [Alkaliphilus hydrothermalis]|uniref:Exfoliative toxin A/B n=1 Tax=Alkaliphilus hydrothermalis TaxID=1482730 RepID=A0ABS2NNR7_9FIRM|nr:TDT family transporter [Alkaliphilus hydrothermalis]MBM7614547.1 exfoliative toxin A/B [Alkaliphilus hydrothermalis]